MINQDRPRDLHLPKLEQLLTQRRLSCNQSRNISHLSEYLYQYYQLQHFLPNYKKKIHLEKQKSQSCSKANQIVDSLTVKRSAQGSFRYNILGEKSPKKDKENCQEIFVKRNMMLLNRKGVLSKIAERSDRSNILEVKRQNRVSKLKWSKIIQNNIDRKQPICGWDNKEQDSLFHNIDHI